MGGAGAAWIRTNSLTESSWAGLPCIAAHVLKATTVVVYNKTAHESPGKKTWNGGVGLRHRKGRYRQVRQEGRDAGVTAGYGGLR